MKKFIFIMNHPATVAQIEAAGKVGHQVIELTSEQRKLLTVPDDPILGFDWFYNRSTEILAAVGGVKHGDIVHMMGQQQLASAVSALARRLGAQLIESITPRVFIKAWQLLDRYHSYGSPFIIWLYKIASNQIIEHFYTHPKALKPDGFLWSIEDRVFDKNVKDMFDLQAIRDALQFLNDEEQQVLTLKFISGVSTNEVARIMEKPISTVQNLLMYALQKVAKHMDEKVLR